MDVAQDDVVLFAIPKKGRIHQDVMKLLKGAGLDAKRPDRLDVAMCKELPIKLVFLPAADIPSYVMEGNVDLGISGSDMLEETLLEEGHVGYEEANVTVLRQLGIGKCKLCLEAPKVLNLNKDPTPLVGKKIVTSFPFLAGRFFKELEAKTGSTTKTSIKVVSGSVEAACGLGLADAVVDLVETGTTMQAAGLEVVSDIFETEALLFKQKTSAKQATKKAEIIDTILRRIDGYRTSTKYVMIVYNCHRDNLQACCKMTPAKRSPTITELKEDGWHAVSSLVPIDRMNAVMDELTKAGAVDVLCSALVNTRM